MIRSLRTRFALSHVLPILLLMPILGLYLLQSLEAFYLQGLLQQLEYQARLLQDEVERFPELAESQPAAQGFLAKVSGLTDAKVVLVSENAVIMAATDPQDVDRVGTRLADAAVMQALKGEVTRGVNAGSAGDIAYVVLPLQHSGVRLGALRLSYSVADVRVRTNQLARLVLVGVTLATMAGLVLGLVLATTVVRPLSELAKGAGRIAAGDYQARVPVGSHDEVEMLARAFNQMAERLQALEQTRQRQLAAIIHELARPMTGMRAALETLQDGADADQDMRRILLSGVVEETARLERLLSTLQGVLQHELRPMHLNHAPVALDRVIRATVALFEPAAARMGISLMVDTPGTLPRLRADEDRVIQVLTNLLDNAIKFTPRGGRIVVQAGKAADTVWVRVTDTGVGIAPDEIAHVFEEFYSGAESRPPEKRGMGLGLAICREIVAAHGGTIRAESEPGQGARFTFTLPA